MNSRLSLRAYQLPVTTNLDLDLDLEKGVDVNKVAGGLLGRGQIRSIDAASKCGDEQILALLLAHGADATKDPQGRYPADVATENGHLGCAAIIKAHLAKEEKRKKEGALAAAMLAEAAADAAAMELLALEDAGEAAKSSSKTSKKKDKKESSKGKKKATMDAAPSRAVETPPQSVPPQDDDAWESFLAAMRLDELAASRGSAAK